MKINTYHSKVQFYISVKFTTVPYVKFHRRVYAKTYTISGTCEGTEKLNTAHVTDSSQQICVGSI